MENTKHFVLVHGLCHGAWCWYKLATLLGVSGHRVTAVDLAGCGADPQRLNEIDSASHLLKPLMKVMDSLGGEEKVVLVGHSYGGLAISIAMETFCEKVSVGVFVSSYMPNTDHPPSTQIQEDMELAKMLIRPSGLYIADWAKESLLTSERFGLLRRVYIVCKDDKLMKEEFQDWVIGNSPPKEVRPISDAGHMVMLSQPKELCLCLEEIAAKYY